MTCLRADVRLVFLVTLLPSRYMYLCMVSSISDVESSFRKRSLKNSCWYKADRTYCIRSYYLCQIYTLHPSRILSRYKPIYITLDVYQTFKLSTLHLQPTVLLSFYPFLLLFPPLYSLTPPVTHLSTYLSTYLHPHPSVPHTNI